jgi:hypothetical protein
VVRLARSNQANLAAVGEQPLLRVPARFIDQ